MNLTIWQFLALVAALVGIYFAYTYWWVDQDQTSWINRMNDNMYQSEEEMKDEPEPAPASGWI